MKNPKENIPLPLAMWAGHMRRGKELRSEKEFAAALALIPKIHDARSHLIKTLRALADLYLEKQQYEEAAGLFERLGEEEPNPTRVFWCDYAKALFNLARQELKKSRAAQAASALERAEQVRRKLPDHAEMQDLAFYGYLDTALHFEFIKEYLPADLYFERAMAVPDHCGADRPDRLNIFLETSAQAFNRRDFERAEHWANAALKTVDHAASGKEAAALRVADFLAGLAQKAFQDYLPKVGERYYGWAESIINAVKGPRCVERANLLMAWGFRRFKPNGAPLFDEAIKIREAVLGPDHAATREARQALDVTLKQVELSQDLGNPPAEDPAAGWDGARRFFDNVVRATEARRPLDGGEDLKELQRRLSKLVHPDLARDPDEFEALNDLMVEVNQAVADQDITRLRGLEVKIRVAFAKLKRTGE
jgi:tetratricopeptide (TPR) repeat protein